MRKIILFGAFVALSSSLFAQIAERQAPKKPEFTVIKEIPITSVKNQARSGTCWNYSTLSFFEAEILKKSGKTYDLCEMFVCMEMHSSHKADQPTTYSMFSNTTASVQKKLCLFQALSMEIHLTTSMSFSK